MEIFNGKIFFDLKSLLLSHFHFQKVLAGQQQSAELKLALDQELRKSRQLEITIRKLDEERRRSDELLYQMISKFKFYFIKLIR